MPIPADQTILPISTVQSGGWTYDGVGPLYAALQGYNDGVSAHSTMPGGYGRHAIFGLTAPTNNPGYGVGTVTLISSDIADNNQGATYYLIDTAGKVIIKWCYGVVDNTGAAPSSALYKSSALITADGGTWMTKFNGNPGGSLYTLPRVARTSEVAGWRLVMSDEIDAGEAPGGGISVGFANLVYGWAKRKPSSQQML